VCSDIRALPISTSPAERESMVLDPLAWTILVLAAALVGFAKTALGGLGSVAVVLFAVVVPARESTGALLPLLICGDVLAVTYYRQHGDWSTLWRLIPGVIPGLVLGTWFVAQVNDEVMRRVIALILLTLVVLQLVQLATVGSVHVVRRPHPVLAVTVGVVAGFTTMAANAGGPVMTLYLILAGLPVMRMIGTAAWFFAVVNLAKLPFSIGIGLVTPSSLAVDLMLLPALVTGAALGIVTVKRMTQRAFEGAALVMSGLSATMLLL
jgi:uncharacterized protein